MRFQTISAGVLGAVLLTACATDLPPEYISSERGCDADLPIPPLTADQRQRNIDNTVSIDGAEPIAYKDPVYPDWAAKQNIEGWVIVTFDLTAEGRVQDPKVSLSEPGNMFDRAAIDAIKDWTFAPAMQDGQAVAIEDQEHIITFCTG